MSEILELKRKLIDLEIENRELKQELLNYEIKFYGCSEEEHLRKELIKEIKYKILRSLYGKKWQNKLLIINEISCVFNQQIVQECYDELLRENLIKESSLLNVEIVCTTPTGRKDCHMKYVITKKDKSGNVIKDENDFVEWICMFCGRD